MRLLSLTVDALERQGDCEAECEQQREHVDAFVTEQAQRVEKRLLSLNLPASGTCSTAVCRNDDNGDAQGDRPKILNTRLERLKAIQIQMENSKSPSDLQTLGKSQHGDKENVMEFSQSYVFGLPKEKALARKVRRNQQRKIGRGMAPDSPPKVALDPPPKRPKASHLQRIRSRAVDRLVKRMEEMKTSNIGREPILLKATKGTKPERVVKPRALQVHNPELEFPNLSFLRRHAIKTTDYGNASREEENLKSFMCPYPAGRAKRKSYRDEAKLPPRLPNSPSASSVETRINTQMIERPITPKVPNARKIHISIPLSSRTAAYARTCHEIPIGQVNTAEVNARMEFGMVQIDKNESILRRHSTSICDDSCSFTMSDLSVDVLSQSSPERQATQELEVNWNGKDFNHQVKAAYTPLPFWTQHRLG